jgi:hypothetical protein
MSRKNSFEELYAEINKLKQELLSEKSNENRYVYFVLGKKATKKNKIK